MNSKYMHHLNSSGEKGARWEKNTKNEEKGKVENEKKGERGTGGEGGEGIGGKREKAETGYGKKKGQGHQKKEKGDKAKFPAFLWQKRNISPLRFHSHFTRKICIITMPLATE